MMYNNGIIFYAVINLSACVDISFCFCWFVEHYRSGSKALGQKLSILKLAAMSLLETLQENDFVNIVVMVSKLKWNETYIWYK